MNTPTSELVEAARALCRTYRGSKDDFLLALERALSRYDAAQPTEETHVKATIGAEVWADGTTYEIFPDPFAKKIRVSFWLPRPQPPQEIEGQVEG